MKIYFMKGLKTAERKIAVRAREQEMKASLIGAGEEEVPKGFLAVYVGHGMRRFVIPTACLCSPEFKEMLEKVEEEFGFDHMGGLRIPCEVEDFEEMLSILNKIGRWERKKKKKRTWK